MSDLRQKFNKAASNVKKLNFTPSNSTLLELYSLFKQSTVGDVNTPKPTSLFKLKEKKKWDAWNNKRGMSKHTAMRKYCSLVENLMS